MNWFALRDEPWKQLVDLGSIELYDEKTGEIHEIDLQNDDPDDVEGLLIAFRYVNEQGQATSRTIVCWKTWRTYSGAYLRGLCCLREELRTFRLDRMSDVVEIRTKTAIPDPTAYFSDYHVAERDRAAQQKADEGRYARLYEARHAVRNGLRILVFLALSDQERCATEDLIIEAFIETRLRRIGANDATALRDRLLRESRALAPTKRSYAAACGAISKDRDEVADVFDHALRLVRADGVESDEEVGAVSDLVQRVKGKLSS